MKPLTDSDLALLAQKAVDGERLERELAVSVLLSIARKASSEARQDASKDVSVGLLVAIGKMQ